MESRESAATVQGRGRFAPLARLGLRAKLCLLLLLVLLPPLLANTVQLGARFREVSRQERLDAEKLAQSVDTTFRQYLELVWTAEGEIGHVLTDRRPTSLSDASDLLRDQLAVHPTLHILAWYSADGRLVAATGPVLSDTVSVQQAGYFRRLISGQDRVVSDLLVHPETGSLFVAIARAFRDGQGHLAGVVTAEVDVDRLGVALLPQPQFSPGIVVITDSQARVVCRNIATNLDYEQRLIRRDNGPVLQAIASKRNASVPSYRSYADGVPRMGTTVYLPGLGWTVSVTVALSELYGPAWRGFYRDSLVLLIGTLLALALGLAGIQNIVRPLRTLQRAALALGQGDLSARTSIPGHDELARTAQGFDRMAEQIERLEEERGKWLAVLRHREALYRAIARSLPNGCVCVVDGNRRFLVAEGPLLAATGFEKERLEGRTLAEVFDEVALEVVGPRWERALAGETITYETNYRSRSLSSTYLPLHDEGGEVYGAMSLAIDLTEHKRALKALEESLTREQQLGREAEEARAQLVKLLAHEIRNPMAGLKGLAQLVEMKAADEKTREITRLMAGEVDRLSRMLTQVLDAFRVQSGTLPIDLRPTDLAGVVDKALAFHQLRGSHRYEVSVRRPTMVMGDACRLEDVIRNLLVNAEKYSAPGSPIQVGLSVADGWAGLSVADQGVGIPADQRQRIFDGFFRASNVAFGGPGGAGLGLYLCKQIVERHGGLIWVESELGQGSTFHVRLPLAAS